MDKTYIMHSSITCRDNLGQKIVAWIYDPSHWAADEDMLYWEFGELP